GGGEGVGVWTFGVEREFVTPSTRGPVPRRVLFYGRYLPLHGIDTIVRAAAILGPHADVVLIGGGPERPRLQRRAESIGSRITWRDELPLAGLRDELAGGPGGRGGLGGRGAGGAGGGAKGYPGGRPRGPRGAPGAPP